MRFIKTVFLILSCVFSVAISVQAMDIDAPNNTRLIDKKSNIAEDKNVLNESELIYDSRLAKKNIISFYQNYLIKQGFKEQFTNTGDRYKKNVFMFKNQPEQKYVKLIFLEEQKDAIKYKLDVMEFVVASKKSGCQGTNCGLQADAKVEGYPFYKKGNDVVVTLYFVEPKKVNFMPMLPGIKQAEYIEWKDAQPPVITMGYLNRQDASAVIDFYLQNMPSYGWSLTDNQPYQGTFSVGEWIPMIAPYTAFQNDYKGLFIQDVPLLKIKGAKMTFVNDSQKCIITVNTFLDVIQLAAQQTLYDVKFMEDYGTTVIGVAYFYEGE